MLNAEAFRFPATLASRLARLESFTPRLVGLEQIHPMFGFAVQSSASQAGRTTLYWVRSFWNLRIPSSSSKRSGIGGFLRELVRPKLGGVALRCFYSYCSVGHENWYEASDGGPLKHISGPKFSFQYFLVFGEDSPARNDAKSSKMAVSTYRGRSRATE